MDKAIMPTRMQQKIYDYIVEHPKASRQEIELGIYGPNYYTCGKTVAVHIYRINKVLRDRGLCIRGKRGRDGGYELIEVRA